MPRTSAFITTARCLLMLLSGAVVSFRSGSQKTQKGLQHHLFLLITWVISCTIPVSSAISTYSAPSFDESLSRPKRGSTHLHNHKVDSSASRRCNWEYDWYWFMEIGEVAVKRLSVLTKMHFIKSSDAFHFLLVEMTSYHWEDLAAGFTKLQSLTGYFAILSICVVVKSPSSNGWWQHPGALQPLQQPHKLHICA